MRPRNEIESVTFTSSALGWVPAKSWIVLRRTNARPSVISRSCSIPAFFRRIGRHMISSSNTPSAAVTTIAISSASASGTPIVTLKRKAM